MELPPAPEAVESVGPMELPSTPAVAVPSVPMIDPFVLQIIKQIYHLVPPDPPIHHSTVSDERAMVQCLVPVLYGSLVELHWSYLASEPAYLASLTTLYPSEQTVRSFCFLYLS